MRPKRPKSSWSTFAADELFSNFLHFLVRIRKRLRSVEEVLKNIQNSLNGIEYQLVIPRAK
jgi:hypothetical protein